MPRAQRSRTDIEIIVRAVIDEVFVTCDTALRAALQRVAALAPAGTVLSGPAAGAPGAPGFAPRPRSLCAWARPSGGGMPLYVSGVYWLLPTISFSTLSSLSEVAFAEGRTLGDSPWTVGGPFALPSAQLLGIDVFAESGLIATPPDTLAFQPRLLRAGGSGWEDDGPPGELGSGAAALSLPYTLTLAPGDRFGIEVYTTGGMVQVPGGLRVVVRLA